MRCAIRRFLRIGAKYIWRMKNITEMYQQTKLKLRHRPRLRTTTKLVMLLGATAFISITIGLIFVFNFSGPLDLFGSYDAVKIVDGRMEMPEQKLSSGFEVRELSVKNTSTASDTVLLFKKVEQ